MIDNEEKDRLAAIYRLAFVEGYEICNMYHRRRGHKDVTFYPENDPLKQEIMMLNSYPEQTIQRAASFARQQKDKRRENLRKLNAGLYKALKDNKQKESE